MKHGYEVPLSDFFLRGGSRDNYMGTSVQSPESGEIYTLSDIIYIKDSSSLFFETGCHPYTPDILDTVRVRRCLFLNLTELYEILPEFEKLSESEQIERLDRIPWFPVEYELKRVTEDLFLY